MKNRISQVLFAALFAGTLLAAGVAQAAVDECLVGTWRIDPEDFGHVFATQMGVDSAEVTGIAEMQIASPGTVQITLADLTIAFTPPGSPEIQVILTGVSDFDSETLESFMYFRDNRAEISVQAMVLGQLMDFPSDALEAIMGGDRNFTSEFGCTEESLAFQTENLGQFPRHWFRVTEG